jgi:RHS repeat-associated protein
VSRYNTIIEQMFVDYQVIFGMNLGGDRPGGREPGISFQYPRWRTPHKNIPKVHGTGGARGAGSYQYRCNGLSSDRWGIIGCESDRVSQTINVVTTNHVMDQAAGLTQVLEDGMNTYLYGNGRSAQDDGVNMGYFLGDRLSIIAPTCPMAARRRLERALGSVCQLTDAEGTVTLTQSYEPYGEVLISEGTGTSIYGFDAEQMGASGLVYLRARYYDQSQGRFISRDLRGVGADIIEPNTLNLWLFADANPVMLVDNTGRGPEDPCGGAYGTCQSLAKNPPQIAADAAHHDPSRKPWNITFTGQNLSSPVIEGSLNTIQQQLITNSSEPDWPVTPVPDVCDTSGYHCGLCGLISVSAILNGVYPGGIKANDVVDDFISFNEYYNTSRYQIGENWPDQQLINELHDFIHASYFAYLYAYSPERPRGTYLGN